MIILKHQLQCALNPLAWLTSSTSSTFVGHCFHTYQPCSLQAVCFLLVHTAGLVCLGKSKYILLQPSLLCKLMQMQDVHRVCALLVIITPHMCTRGKKIGLCVCCPCCHIESCQVRRSRQLSDSYRPTDTDIRTGENWHQYVSNCLAQPMSIRNCIYQLAIIAIPRGPYPLTMPTAGYAHVHNWPGRNHQQLHALQVLGLSAKARRVLSMCSIQLQLVWCLYTISTVSCMLNVPMYMYMYISVIQCP